MDNVKLKKNIKSFATDIALATMMTTLALAYIPIVIQEQGYWALAVCDVICAVADTCFAVSDWKKIKVMLEENVNAQE